MHGTVLLGPDLLRKPLHGKNGQFWWACAARILVLEIGTGRLALWGLSPSLASQIYM